MPYEVRSTPIDGKYFYDESRDDGMYCRVLGSMPDNPAVILVNCFPWDPDSGEQDFQRLYRMTELADTGTKLFSVEHDMRKEYE